MPLCDSQQNALNACQFPFDIVNTQVNYYIICIMDSIQALSIALLNVQQQQPQQQQPPFNKILQMDSTAWNSFNYIS